MYAHDHMVARFPPTEHSNLHFVNTGIGASSNVTDRGQVKTLDALLEDNGHSQTVIQYLKVCLLNF